MAASPRSPRVHDADGAAGPVLVTKHPGVHVLQPHQRVGLPNLNQSAQLLVETKQVALWVLGQGCDDM